MKFLRILVVAMLAMGLASCVKNEAEFEAVRVALKKRPDIQAQGLADCSSRVRHSGIEAKREIANYARIRLDDALPGTFCGRLLKGYLNGRLKWQDYEAIRGGNRQRITPNLVRIIRGG